MSKAFKYVFEIESLKKKAQPHTPRQNQKNKITKLKTNQLQQFLNFNILVSISTAEALRSQATKVFEPLWQYFPLKKQKQKWKHIYKISIFYCSK